MVQYQFGMIDTTAHTHPMTNPDFGAWLRQLRTTHDLTQESLAEAVGCAAETVRSFENGRRRPSRQMAERLADVLHLPLEERQIFIQRSRSAQGSATSANPAALPIAHQHDQPSVHIPPDALIGRREELQRLRTALIDEQRRLITVLGPGGIGKTRLALQIAADLAPHFADGAAFVALASLADAAHVAPAIAEQLGSVLPSAQSHDAALVNSLRNRKLLLVLDNLEHLLGPEHGPRIAALLTQIMLEAPGVQVLITSRQRLVLRGTWTVELDALHVPAAEQVIGVERSDAVLLFLDRARQIDGDFALTLNNRAAVVRICRLLGGVPLAIELAASWLRVLTCPEIAAEIEKSFEFLGLSESGLPPRHQSLRAVMEHSWQLLSPAEELLLMQLSVFQGGCRREAIAAVAPARLPGGRLGSQDNELLVQLAALVDKSLLQRVPDQDGTTRYTMHEMVRQFAAANHAKRPDDLAIIQARHAAFYAKWVEQQGRELQSPRQKEALHALTADIDNVRAAWRYACEHGKMVLLRQMAIPLDWFYELRGWHAEASAMFAQAHQQFAHAITQGDPLPELRIGYWLLVGRGGWHLRRRDPTTAGLQMRQAVEQLCELDQREPFLRVATGMGYLQIFAGDYDEAEALLTTAHNYAVYNNLLWHRSIILVVRGVLEVFRSDATIARQHLAQALVVARECGDPRHIAHALSYLGIAALSLGLVEEAERYCNECLALAAENKDRFQMSQALLLLGRVALSREDTSTSTWMFDEGHTLACEIGDRWLEAQALGYKGKLAAHQGDQNKAAQQFRAAATTAAAAPLPFALDALAALAEFEFESRPHAALTALAYVLNHPRTRPDTRDAVALHWQQASLVVEQQHLTEAEGAAARLSHEQPITLLHLFA